MVMNFQVPKQTGNCLAKCVTISFSKRTPLYGIIQVQNTFNTTIVLWYMIPYSPVEIYWRFRQINYLHIQERGVTLLLQRPSQQFLPKRR